MEALQILKELLAIKSYPRYSQKDLRDGDPDLGEEDVALYIEKFLEKNCPNLKIEKQHVYGKRYNLIASDGEPTKLIFCCHMDTVDPKEHQIKGDNLVVEEEEDKLYGLGSVDMKGGTAALLSMLAKLSSDSKGLKLIFYCDEEENFLGMKKLLSEKKFSADLAIFCEPSDLKIGNGCRGLIEFFCYVHGKAAHASVPSEGLNAISVAGSAAALFEVEVGKFTHPDLGASVCNLAGLHGGSADFEDNTDGYHIKNRGNSVS